MLHDRHQSAARATRHFFASGATRPLSDRITQLKALRAALRANEAELLAALKQDLGKGEYEGYTSEIGFTLEELGHTLKHLHEWAQPRSVGTPMLLQPATSASTRSPKGSC